MIGVDTNILVYAHRKDSSWHEQASKKIQELAEGASQWTISWPCVHEFLAVVTHPKIYNPPTDLSAAIRQIDYWFESPSLVVLGEGDNYWASLKTVLQNSKVVGPKVHDARVASICLVHGIEILWSADRDFSRFTANLKVVNPLS